MSLPHIATRFVGVPLMIHPPKLEVIIQGLQNRLGINVDPTSFVSVDEKSLKLKASYGDMGDDRDYEVCNGVAIIPVQGTLMKRLTGMAAWSGGCSYISIQSQLQNASNDAGVRSILLDIDSPGGEVAGCFELADYIRSIRGKKPIYASANDCALSAAYAIASSAEKVFVTTTGAVGSIGVYALHTEQSALDEKVGLKFTYLFAGDRKVDGNPHEPLSDSARNDIQTEVNREYQMFVDCVAKNRDVSKKEIKDTQARLLWAGASIPLLADQIGTFDDAFNELASKSIKGLPVGRSTAEAVEVNTKGQIMENINTSAENKADYDEAKDPKKNKKDMAKDKEDMDMSKDKTDNKEMSSDKKDDDDMDDSDGDSMKKAKGFSSVISGSVSSIRTNDDSVAIANLCSMAGFPEKTAEYLSLRTSNGNLMSVGDVSKELLGQRAKLSEGSSVMNHVDVNQGNRSSASSMDQLISQAQAFAKTQIRNVEVPRMYGEGTRRGTTPEQAVAAALESNPEVYQVYREKHNAADLLNKLRAAGIKFVSA